MLSGFSWRLQMFLLDCNKTDFLVGLHVFDSFHPATKTESSAVHLCPVCKQVADLADRGY
jgi:hypothetical protein